MLNFLREFIFANSRNLRNFLLAKISSPKVAASNILQCYLNTPVKAFMVDLFLKSKNADEMQIL